MAVANNTVVEYLPEFLINKYGKILGEARTYTESVYNELEQFFRALTKLIAEKEGYNPIHLSDLFYDEYKNYLDKRILPTKEEVEERYLWSGLHFDERKRYLLDGHQVVEIEHVIFDKQNGSKINELKGKVASPGKAQGICRIVPHPDRIQVFNIGDILITGMTRPNFVPLMKRAGAIVTDAGGLLCHAAIISRELGKPCLIGTEIATKVFKDGDLVEVDANKGIVRKI
jgi:phosphohistidine swiveling domain-containing protein